MSWAIFGSDSLLGSSVQFGDSNFPKGTEKLEKVQDRASEQ